MNSALLAAAAQLLKDRRPYALATVVRRERPSSATPGNTAVITADGELHGWIGGSCTQPEVVRHALDALAEARPRLLAFGGATGERDGVVAVPMSCGSEGKVDVHINPVLPPPRLVVAGDSPIADALVRLGRAMRYEVDRLTPGGNERAVDPVAEWEARAPGDRLLAVVATMGRGDEAALAGLAAAKPDYLGVVASPKRMRQLRRIVVEMGVAEDQAARIRGPAGLDIGAGTPEEVAVSIVAEIVAGQDQGGSREQYPGGDGIEKEAGEAVAAKSCCRGKADGDAHHQTGVASDPATPRCATEDDGDAGAAPRSRAQRDESMPAAATSCCVTETAAAPTAAGQNPQPSRGGAGRPGDAPRSSRAGVAAHRAGAPGRATDPVCGMTVPADGSSPSFTLGKRTVHFCCDGCRDRFAANPAAWV